MFSLRDLGPNSDATSVLDKIRARKFHLTCGWRSIGESLGGYGLGEAFQVLPRALINGSKRDDDAVSRTRRSPGCTPVRGIVACSLGGAALPEFGHLGRAGLLRQWVEAPGAEPAARWRAGGARRTPCQNDPGPLLRRIRLGDR